MPRKGGKAGPKLTAHSAVTGALRLAYGGISFDALRHYCRLRRVDFGYILRLLRKRRYLHLRWAYQETRDEIQIVPQELTLKELGLKK